MQQGLIVKGIGGFYYVQVDREIFECKARGIFRNSGIIPLPGDRVEIEIMDRENKLGSIEAILPRTSQLVRPHVANVDQVAVIISVKSPKPDLLLLDKILITAVYKNIQPIICISKIDLDIHQDWIKISESYSKSGYKVCPMSLVDNEGLDLFNNELLGKITVLAGQSGVGKSTVLNGIMKNNIMQTGKISEKIDRGKHTTRHAELIQLIDGGYIIDTPGFSSFELLDIKHNELHMYFQEMSNILDECKFNGCNHLSEPGCKVKESVEKGDIDNGRYDRYKQIFKELKEKDKNKYSK